ncbi:hypothetical protein ANCCAN_18281, partial [Ancylostoma caninum]
MYRLLTNYAIPWAMQAKRLNAEVKKLQDDLAKIKHRVSKDERKNRGIIAFGSTNPLEVPFILPSSEYCKEGDLNEVYAMLKKRRPKVRTEHDETLFFNDFIYTIVKK